jgi:hypothetical protein
MTSFRKFGAAFVAVVVLTAALTIGFAGSASAQTTTQNGLVNVSLSDTTVQVPVSVAANICGVNVGVLSTILAGGPTTCDATSSSGAAVPLTIGGPATTIQSGLVNVALTDTTVQVPISVAANLCGVNVAILAVLESPGTAQCTATSHSNAGG